MENSERKDSEIQNADREEKITEAEKRRAYLEAGDAIVSVDRLRQAAAAFRDVRNWKPFHNPKDLAVAIAVEAAEVLELCRFKTNEEIAASIKAGDHSFADEMADVLSYLLSLADVLNIDAEHYPVKLAKGRAAKYTEQRERPEWKRRSEEIDSMILRDNYAGQ